MLNIRRVERNLLHFCPNSDKVRSQWSNLKLKRKKTINSITLENSEDLILKLLSQILMKKSKKSRVKSKNSLELRSIHLITVKLYTGVTKLTFKVKSRPSLQDYLRINSDWQRSSRFFQDTMLRINSNTPICLHWLLTKAINYNLWNLDLMNSRSSFSLEIWNLYKWA